MFNRHLVPTFDHNRDLGSLFASTNGMMTRMPTYAHPVHANRDQHDDSEDADDANYESREQWNARGLGARPNPYSQRVHERREEQKRPVQKANTGGKI